MMKYRMCKGLAMAPDKDMKMLSDMSKKGWHLTKFSLLGYFFEEGEPQDYIYALNTEQIVTEDMLSLYRESGWTPVIVSEGYQIFRAEEGTPPIFSDAESEIEVLRKNQKSSGVAALVFGVLLVATISLTNTVLQPHINETVSLIMVCIFMICFIFTFFPFVGFGISIHKKKKYC